jgi:hypothetical protein
MPLLEIRNLTIQWTRKLGLAAGSGLCRQKTNLARLPSLSGPKQERKRKTTPYGSRHLSIKIDTVDGEAQGFEHKKEFEFRQLTVHGIDWEKYQGIHSPR